MQYEEKLYFEGNDNIKKPLPNWAIFFVKLGIQLAQISKGNSRVVLAITLPSRTFISSLIAVGFVIIKSSASLIEEREEYFQEILKLPNGTPVFYRDAYFKVFSGFLDGICIVNNEQYIRVTYQQGGSFLVNQESIYRISLSNRIKKNLPILKSGRKSIFNNTFISPWFKESRHIQEFYNSCTIFGNITLLEEEIKSTDFFVKSTINATYHRGVLNELIRVKNFLSVGDAYNTNIYSTQNNAFENDEVKEIANFVVFDGANGYLKWRDYCPKSNLILLLERTEARFDEGVEAFNNNYIIDRLDDWRNEIVLEAPIGISLLGYEESI